jgi:hypothetical protein
MSATPLEKGIAALGLDLPADAASACSPLAAC